MTSTNDYELKKLIMMQQARRPLKPHADRVNKSKSNLHYARGITPKCVTSGVAHLRCFGRGQHSFEETSQRWRHCADFTGPVIEPQTSRTNSVRLTTKLTV